MSPESDPIRHVVALALENHSFDQMLGCLKPIFPHLEGIDPNNLRMNPDPAGKEFAQAETTERQMLLDPHHEVGHVATQLANGNGGFVLDFAQAFPASNDQSRQFIMSYYPLDYLPALHSLAKDFTICDHWFSSLPGPTWPNRFFALTGTSNGHVNMPDDGTQKADVPGYFQQDQDTIFDRLTEKGVDWKCYFHDIPQSWVLKHRRMPHNAARYFYIREFFADARNAEAEFPQFCFIEPDFMGINENDDHPPHDVMKAEKLIADVYNALRGNAELWRSTLLVIFYDEHGGFYDHVVPPPAPPPDEHREEYTFDRFGLRVPALLVSPWVERRIESTLFDHTSLLRYLTDKWDLTPLPSARMAAANSIKVAITRSEPRTDTLAGITLTPAQLTVPDLDREEEGAQMISAHHLALQKLAAYLPEALWEDIRPRALEEAPQLYSAIARGLEWVKRGINSIKAGLARFLEGLKAAVDALLARLYQHGGAEVSIAEPDKLAIKFGAERDHVATFLMHQKPRAMRGLTQRIQDRTTPVADRDHALRTLASITGRQFHLHDVEHARTWLAKSMH
jgi:phospholipase C